VMYQQTYQAAHAPATADETGQQHLRITQARTASLFEAGARCAAILAGASPEVEAALAAYGQGWGLVWQLSRESHAEAPTAARPTQLSQTALSAALAQAQAALAQAQAALAQARQGLSGLPESPYRQGLLDTTTLA
jgi:octaprenyl-diphosphate synthase